MFIFLLILVLLAVGVTGSFLYVGRRKRKARIAEMLSGDNLLAAWTYDPEEFLKHPVYNRESWPGSKNIEP